MKDFKKVLQFIGQRYELKTMLPTGKESPFKWKGQMEDFNEKAIEINFETPKIIKYKAYSIIYSIPIIITMLLFYVLKAKFSIIFFLFLAFHVYLGEELIGYLLWEIIKVIKKNGLIKGLTKILIGLITFAGFIIFCSFLEKI